MSKSPLATVFVAADPSNYTKGRSKTVTDITIHHMAGRCTAKRCGEFWQDPSRNASSTYGIGYNGEIGCYLDENDTPWTNSNWDSNCRSITIEVANEYQGGDWKVTDASLNSLIKLVADIAKRRGLGTLVKGKNVTWHSMFANTNCPGPYLLSKMDYIVNEANKINSSKPNPEPTPSTGKFKIGDKVVINGVLYTSSTGDEKGKSVKNKVTNITRYAAGAKHPYNTTGDLGWMDESSISLYTEPVKESFKVGDVVVPTKLVDYNGTHLVQYDKNYVITELKGNRAVLCANRDGKLYVWAAMNTDNIKKA